MTYRWTIGAAVLVALSSVAVIAQADAPPSALVTMMPLRAGTLAHTVVAYGQVQASDAARRTITAQASDTVGAVYVHEGDEVAAGAALLQLVPSADTAAAYAQAQSALRVAGQLVERTKRMFDQHLATAQELAQAQKAQDDARVTLNTLTTQGAAGARIVRAPFRAIVLRLSASPGTAASAGTALVELARPDSVVLRAGVTSADAALVARGDAAQVSALDETRQAAGKVAQRGSLIDPASGLVPVDIALPADRFLPGQTAMATITVGEIRGYVVPHAAILVNNHGDPYVVQSDHMKARKVAVRIVGSQGDDDAIEGPKLDANQPLVLSGNYQLDDGMSMRVATPDKQEAK